MIESEFRFYVFCNTLAKIYFSSQWFLLVRQLVVETVIYQNFPFHFLWHRYHSIFLSLYSSNWAFSYARVVLNCCFMCLILWGSRHVILDLVLGILGERSWRALPRVRMSRTTTVRAFCTRTSGAHSKLRKARTNVLRKSRSLSSVRSDKRKTWFLF